MMCIRVYSKTDTVDIQVPNHSCALVLWIVCQVFLFSFFFLLTLTCVCFLPLSHSFTQVCLHFFFTARRHRKGFSFFIRFHLISSMNSNQASIACDFILYVCTVYVCMCFLFFFFRSFLFLFFKFKPSRNMFICLFVCTLNRCDSFSTGIFTWVIIIWQFAWESKEWSAH